jgi:hypothetical protein
MVQTKEIKMRSFQIVTFVSFITALASTAQAQTASGYVGLLTRTDVVHTKNSFMLELGVDHAISERFGISAYGLVMNGWGEIYAGPSFKPTANTSVGAWFGGEQGAGGKIVPRYALSTMDSGHGFFFLAWVEMDDDVFAGKSNAGLWYNTFVTRNVAKTLDLGLQCRRPDGLGPRASYRVGPVKAWVAWTPWLPETNAWREERIIAGIDLFL